MQKSRRAGRMLCLAVPYNGTIATPYSSNKSLRKDSLLRIIMKKLVLSLSLVLAISSVSGAFAAIPQKLRIGTDPTYAPFESKNSQGELVGFDIDLAKELCTRIKTQCVFIENPLDALIPSLKAKKSTPSCHHSQLLKNANRKFRSPTNCMLRILVWSWRKTPTSFPISRS
jgi:hypothetical protein